MQLSKDNIDTLAKFIYEDANINSLVNVIQNSGDNYVHNYLDFVALETNDKQAQIGLQLHQHVAELDTVFESITMTATDVYDMKACGVDAVEASTSKVIECTKNKLIRSVLSEIYSLGHENYLESFTRFDKLKTWVYKLFSKTYIKSYNVKNNTSLLGKLFLFGNKVAITCRRGSGDICIIGPGLLNKFIDMTMFVHADTVTNEIPGILQYAGNIGAIKIMVNNELPYNDKSIIVMRKSKRDESGLHLVYDKNALSIMTICEVTMAPKVGAKTKHKVFKTDNAKVFIQKFYVNYKENSKLL